MQIKQFYIVYAIMLSPKKVSTKNQQKAHDYLAKIVIIGDSSVGKTNILMRFVTLNYTMSHTPTIGVDFKSKVIGIQTSNNKNVTKFIKLQLWDTAGQERFRTMTETYYAAASGIVIVYAINDRKSFQNVKDWLYQIAQKVSEKLPKIIVGNKCDLREQRKVSFEEARILADQNHCNFMEVSAKQNINIDEVFLQLAMAIDVNVEKEKERKLFQESIQDLENKRKSHNIVINKIEKKDQRTKLKEECCK